MKYAFGIDMGGTTTKIGLFSGDGTLTDSTEITTRSASGFAAVMDDIAASVRQLAAARSIALSDCAAGIGLPGVLGKDGYLEAAVNLNMYGVYPAQELSARLDGIPVFAENDANNAALGEMWQGGGKGYSSLVLITLGTGIGSGIVVDHKILHGAHGFGGEIGHISVDPNEPERCNCGGRGCLDQMASATGIVRNARRFLDRTDRGSLLRGIPALTAKDVIDAAKAGDEVAMEALTYCMSFLGKMIAYVSYIVDPEVFVIGGGISKAGDFILDLIFEQYTKYPTAKRAYTKFALAKLHGLAGMYGAAFLAFSQGGLNASDNSYRQS